MLFEDNQPDFAQWQRKRAEDDLSEECPNLAPSSHTVRAHRPNNTPRRLKH